MINKLKVVLQLFRSRSFIVILDNTSVLSIPMADISSMENQFILNAQSASIAEFISKLEEAKEEHDRAIQLLAHRDKGKASKTSTRKKKLPVSQKRR